MTNLLHRKLGSILLIPIVALAAILPQSKLFASTETGHQQIVHHKSVAPLQALLWGFQQAVPKSRIETDQLLPLSSEQVDGGPFSGVNPSSIAALGTAAYDLLQYVANNTDPRTAQEILAQLPHYNRVDMYGTWVNEDAPQNCYNTRMEVLIRDASDPSTLEYSPKNPCNVIKGTWNDPYSGTQFKLASAVQIDHVVPLKNSYLSGAHAWKKERRCHYANYLRNPFHLLAVSGHENMSKGDNAPDEYMPPDSKFKCEYIATWLKIKAIWNLELTGSEAQAIRTEINANHCDRVMFMVEDSFMQTQRAQTMNINAKCVEAVAATSGTPVESTGPAPGTNSPNPVVPNPIVPPNHSTHL